MLDRFFQLSANNTTIRTELLAGLTTFLTMVYIIFVNPSILGDAGMPKDVGVRRHLPGRRAGHRRSWACTPTTRSRMAPGMGLNAYFAYAVVLGMGIPWQSALGAVFISGCLFILVTLFGLREHDRQRHSALAAGRDHGRAGHVPRAHRPEERRHRRRQPRPRCVTLGDLHQPPALMAIVGFFADRRAGPAARCAARS